MLKKCKYQSKVAGTPPQQQQKKEIHYTEKLVSLFVCGLLPTRKGFTHMLGTHGHTVKRVIRL